MSNRIKSIMLGGALVLSPILSSGVGAAPVRVAATSSVLTMSTGTGFWACLGALLGLAGAYVDGDTGDKAAAWAAVKEAC